MKFILAITCIIALGLTVIPPLLFAAGHVSEPSMKSLMLAGMLLWFPAAIGWDRLGSANSQKQIKG
jgi:hypothetical protein